MRSWAVVGLAVAFPMVVAARDTVSATTPRPTPDAATQAKRAQLPSCAELRPNAAEISAAFRKHSAEADGDIPEGEGAFDAIGDELGCRWPWSAEDSRRGLMYMLERGGGSAYGGSINGSAGSTGRGRGSSR